MLEFATIPVSPLELVLLLLLFAIAAGAMGALLGLGGGVFIVPVLVVLFAVNVQTAVVASLVSVIGTSSGSAAAYVREGLSDLRVAMFLEIATVIGGISGALISVTILAGRSQLLALAFVPVVLLAAALMYRGRAVDTVPNPSPDRWADRLRLHGQYYDTARQETVEYRVTGSRPGLAISWCAGVVSGLLGIGGGLFVVPGMNSVMNVPLRVASATSNFMIGVTATAGALVYLLSGHLAVALAAPVALGTVSGSFLGARLHRTSPTQSLKLLFVVILVLTAVVMFLRGVGWLV